MLRLDESGEVLWNCTLYTDMEAPRWDGQILQLPNGDFIIVSQFPSDTVDVRKISSEGNPLWARRLHWYEATSGFRHRVMPALTPRGTVIFPVSYKSSNNTMMPMDTLWSIVEIDAEGEITGEHPTVISGYEMMFMGIKPARSGGYYLTGYQKINSSVHIHAIIRTDAAYNVLWNKFFKTLPDSTMEHFGQRQIHDIIEPDDSTFIAGGIDAALDGGELSFAFVAFNSGNGERIWNHLIPDSYDISYSIPSFRFYLAPDGYPFVMYCSRIGNQSYALKINKFGTKFPPRFTSDPAELNRTIPEGSPYTETVTAIDTFPSSKLTFSCAATCPSTMTINTASGVIAWTPGNDDAGTVDITLFVADQAGQRDTLTYRLIVTDVNTAPEFVARKPDGVAYAGYSYIDSVTAVDAEGSPLAYSVLTGPEGLTVAGNSGRISWLPTFEDTGSHPVSLCVSDGTLADSMEYTVHVRDSVPVHPTSVPVSAIFDIDCRAYWKFTDGAILTISFDADDCTTAAATLTYKGFTVSPLFPDVVGFFFDLSLDDIPEGGTVTFSHPGLTENYTLAVLNGGSWTPRPSSVFTPDDKALSADPTSAIHWVAVDKSIFSVRENRTSSTCRKFSTRHTAGTVLVSLPDNAHGVITCTVLRCNGAVSGRYTFPAGNLPSYVSIPLREIGIHDNNLYLLQIGYGTQSILTRIANCR